MGDEDDLTRLLQRQLRVLQREAHHLRGWDPDADPAFFAQQVRNRALSTGLDELTLSCDRRLAGRNEPHSVLLWSASLDSPELIRTLVGHAYAVRAVAVTPDGSRAVSASYDHTLKVWDLASGRELRALVGHAEGVIAVAVTPDGSRTVSASNDGTLRVWDLASGRELRALVGHTSAVRAVAVTPDGSRAVSASDDGTLKVWDLASGHELRALVGHAEGVIAVAVTSDGSRAVSASSDRTLKVWDLDRGRCLATVAFESPPRCVAIAPNGVTLVVGDAAGGVHALRQVLPRTR